MGLLESALKDLNESEDFGVRVMARTRASVYLARKGDSALAREHIAALRGEANPDYFAVSTCGAILAEGVLAYVQGERQLALDRLRRARAISTQFGEVRRWAEAWLAHVAFDADRYEELRDCHSSAISDVRPGEHAVLARIGATLGGATHYFGRFDLAKPWYEFARQHAVAEGDDLTIDAVLYNVAAIRLNDLRLQQINGAPDPSEAHRAELELRSSVNYDRLKNSLSFRYALPLLEAQCVLLKGDYEAAARLYRAWFVQGSMHTPIRIVASAKADFGAALARSGQSAEACGLIDEVRNTRTPDSSDDDLALIKYRAAEVARCLGQSADHELAMAEARAHLADHRRAQQKGLATLAGVADAARLGLNLPS